MRRWPAALAVALGAVALAPAATGDGGILRARRAFGSITLSLLTAPTPLRPGAMEVGVLVQDTATGQPREDVPVEFAWWPAGRRDAARVRGAAPGRGANRLLAGAVVEGLEAGPWVLEVRAGPATLRVDLEVARALPPLRAQWKPLLIPPLGIALLALHEALRRQTRRVSATKRSVAGSSARWRLWGV